MNKTKIHLVSNAHLDPVWLWEWEDGAGAALSTFRQAAAFCEERRGYVFCHNESVLYQWVKDYEPALFARIRKLVKSGRWHVMGGWYVQPDCNMPSGESFVRQILLGHIDLAYPSSFATLTCMISLSGMSTSSTEIYAWPST